jgi:hypothetical protein
LTAKLPTASYDKGLGTGKADVDLTWIITKPVTEKFGVHLNLGHTWTGNHDGDVHDDLVHHGVALDCQVAEPVQLVAEVCASTPVTAGSETTVRVNGGVRWQAWDAVVFDAAVGTGLYQDAAEITVTVGLTWAFGFGK